MKTKEKNRRYKFYKYIDQWRESGLTQADFCKEQGISQHVLKYYITQKNIEYNTEKSIGHFIPVEISGSKQPQVLTITYSNNVRLEVPLSITPDKLKSLINLI